MKALSIPFAWCGIITMVAAQQPTVSYVQGSVSFVSSQHIYVKYSSTVGIEIGDTLFFQREGRYQAGLIVKNKSTVSCVAVVLSGVERPVVGTPIYMRGIFQSQGAGEPRAPAPRPPVVPNPDPVPSFTPPKVDRSETERNPKEEIRGRISAASYSSLSGQESVHQMRYSLSIQGNRIGSSRFSTDNYLTFRHTLGQWGEVKNNLNRAIVIYSLGVKYQIDSSASVMVGRKVNPNISSMGSIDGLQYETKWGRLQGGAILGSRPDFEDYGINFNLLQAGAYISYGIDTGYLARRSTFAFVEQRNHFKTDRRFAYFQQTATLGPAMHLFTSFELDLFSNINDSPKGTFRLTNTLVSVQINPSRKISFSGAYDNRKNVIYYESYKNFIDRLIEDETRQGLRTSVSYRPFKSISLGANASWRFQKKQANASKNINTYLNFNQIPGVDMSASFSGNILQTDYLRSRMLGLRLSKEIVSGVLNVDLNGRYVDYNYTFYENKVTQYIGGVDLSATLSRKLALHLYYEGTFDQANTALHRLHLKAIQRF